MSLPVKLGVPKLPVSFNEAFIGHLNATFLDNNAQTVGSSDRRETHGSFIKLPIDFKRMGREKVA
jgi:hypothetical protein